jgi:hypothetical protein
MKLTYKKGGTMGGCYKCGGKMHAAKGMKMGACYKCGGKMYGQNGMVMGGDPPVTGAPSSIPQGKIPAPPNLYGNYTAVNDNTTNKIQILPTNNELAYNNSMANRPVITATKPKSQPKSSSKEQESIIQKILQEEQDKMTGPLSGKPPASGAVNSLGVIGENWLAENPDVALALALRSPQAFGFSLATQGGKQLLKTAALNALKFGKNVGKTYLTNPYVYGASLATTMLPNTTKAVDGFNRNINPSTKDKLNVPYDTSRSNIMTSLGYLSGFGRLFPNRLIRNLSNITSGAVQGSGAYDIYQGNYGQGFAQLLAPGIGSIGGKALISGMSKIPKGKPNTFWNKITTGTQKMAGFSGDKSIGYNKSTGSFTSMDNNKYGFNRKNRIVSPMESFRGFNLKNVFPSTYLFNPKSWKSTNLKTDLNKVINERRQVKNLNLDLKEFGANTQKKLEIIKDFKSKSDKFLGKVNREYKGAYTYTPPSMSFNNKLMYNMRTKPISTTAKGLGLLGASALAGDYMFNDSKLLNKTRSSVKGLFNK